MNETGYRQGYYIGLFGRFLWLFFIYFLIHSMILYTFDVNWFTYWGLSVIFSFLINTSMPMGQSYAFLRHGFIFFCFILSYNYISYSLISDLYRFFAPPTFWQILLIASIPFGIATSFGRYGNGTYSKNIEVIGNFILLIFLALGFVFYWWKGAVVYLVFRILFIFVETLVANYMLNHFRDANESNYRIEQ